MGKIQGADDWVLLAVVHAGRGGPLPGADTESLAIMSYLVALEPAGSTDRAEWFDFARALCTNLPQLQRDGDPKWREVRLGSQPDVGWPYSQQAAQALHACANTSSPAPPGPSAAAANSSSTP